MYFLKLNKRFSFALPRVRSLPAAFSWRISYMYDTFRGSLLELSVICFFPIQFLELTTRKLTRLINKVDFHLQED